MNVLVTGGAGYIGSHTVHALAEGGHQVVAYDNLSSGHRAAVSAQRLTVGDLADGPLLTRELKEHHIQAVVHCAASADVSHSIQDPATYFRNNIATGISFLECLRQAGVRFLVFSSSAAVYGDPQRLPIVEDDPTRPKSPYGLSKRVFEEILHWYDVAYSLRYVSLRYFCAAGAAPAAGLGEDHRPERHLIPSILLSLLGQRAGVEIYGTDYPTEDGTPVRDFIHVLDLAQAHIVALEYLQAGGSSQTFNVGLGRGFSVRQVIEAVQRVTGRPVQAKAAPPRPGDPAVLVADPKRLMQALDWRPRFCQLEEIIDSAWQWHQGQPRGYPE